MSDMWMPDATRLTTGGAGAMDGTHGTRKVVLHNEGVDRGSCDAMQLARYVRDNNIGYHLIYSPWTGQFVQLYPANVAARSLLNPGTLPWSPNKQGDLCVQVCVGGLGADPITGTPMKNWARLQTWVTDLGVPATTPQDWVNPTRSQDDWIRSGWHGHMHAPGNDHTDPGTRNNLELLLGPTGGDDMPTYGETTCTPFTLPAGAAQWVTWSTATDVSIAGAPGLDLGGKVVTATLELKARGNAGTPLLVTFAEIEMVDGQAVDRAIDRDTRTLPGSVATILVTDTLKVNAGRKLRVKLANYGDQAVTCESVQLRLMWW